MFRLIKLSKSKQSKVFRFFIIGIYVLFLIYWIVLGLTTQVNSLIIEYNSNKIKEDESKIKISHVNEENNVFLEDGSSYKDESIKEYIKVSKGTGTYFIPNSNNTGIMSVEVCSSEAISIVKGFAIMCVVILIEGIVGIFWAGNSFIKRILFLLLYIIVLFFSNIIISYWNSILYKSKFNFNTVFIIGYILIVLSVIIKSVIEKKILISNS